MIDYEALFKISYGLYIVSSGEGQKGNGFISNTVFQVTSEPPRFATCCNKNNFTAHIIAEHGAFAVSVLDQNASQDIISRFGYKSGAETSKLEGMRLRTGETGVPVVLNDAIAFLECRVIQTVDLGTHLMFIGDLVQAVVLDSANPPMTYEYYHKVKKGLAPKNAPTYIDASKLAKPVKKEGAKQYKCTACGYIYDEAEEAISFADLPDDWVCPLCGSEKIDFIEL